MTAPEFSHRVALDKLASHPQDHVLKADAAALAALAARFDLVAIGRLEATVAVSPEGRGAALSGRLLADVTQRCVVSGEPVAARVDVPLVLRFEPLDADVGDLELEADALDVQPVEDGLIDLGEAVAQSLFLALDPYPRADDNVLAEVRRRLLSEEEAAAAEARAKADASPFAVLKRP
jgi:uncharacterized metal-binding protein YceD (DUF177 family)